MHPGADGVLCPGCEGQTGGPGWGVHQVGDVILGQMGSYVPAVRARLGVLDGVYTR